MAVYWLSGTYQIHYNFSILAPSQCKSKRTSAILSLLILSKWPLCPHRPSDWEWTPDRSIHEICFGILRTAWCFKVEPLGLWVAIYFIHFWWYCQLEIGEQFWTQLNSLDQNDGTFGILQLPSSKDLKVGHLQAATCHSPRASLVGAPLCHTSGNKLLASRFTACFLVCPYNMPICPSWLIDFNCHCHALFIVQ